MIEPAVVFDKSVDNLERERERGTWREGLRVRYALWTASLIRDFEVGDGWRFLVENFFNALDERLGGEMGCRNLRVIQVKEKLGLLRVYFHDVPEEAQADTRAAVDHAMQASIVSCEVCGGSGTLIKTGGWLRVRCTDHEELHTASR